MSRLTDKEIQCIGGYVYGFPIKSDDMEFAREVEKEVESRIIGPSEKYIGSMLVRDHCTETVWTGRDTLPDGQYLIYVVRKPEDKK